MSRFSELNCKRSSFIKTSSGQWRFDIIALLLLVVLVSTGPGWGKAAAVLPAAGIVTGLHPKMSRPIQTFDVPAPPSDQIIKLDPSVMGTYVDYIVHDSISYRNKWIATL